MEPYNDLNSFQLDILREAGNIGAGHAATSLSQLLGRKIEMEVPGARIASLTEVTEWIGGADQLVAAVFLRVGGDVTGGMFLVVTIEEASSLIQYLTGDSEVTLENEPGLSALQEAGNILAGSYLSSLSDFTGLGMKASPPEVIMDMAGAILGSGLTETSRFGEHAILIETSFSEWDEIKGRFLFLPDPDAVPTVFKALGVSADE
ncbi:MAG TPA: chemotaxis protein CheC [Bacillales bacterium]|nr:chemotaxis protein CheC [Bacillales bacterium]